LRLDKTMARLGYLNEEESLGLLRQIH
jgi:hypothetical protein